MVQAAYLGTREKYFHARMRKKTAAAAIMNVEINLRAEDKIAIKKLGFLALLTTLVLYLTWILLTRSR